MDEAVATSLVRLPSVVAAAGRGRRPRSMDLLIAATAHAHADRLHTRHAGNLTGLEAEIDVVEV